jgi:SAM-dependent methyltransferase
LSLSGVLTQLRDLLLERGSLYNFVQRTVGSTNARRYFVENFARLPTAARVLDIGCGPGTIVPFLPRHLAQYVGFDPNPRYIQVARHRFGSDSHTFFEAECSNAGGWLAERGCRFDAILAAGVLHHLDDREVRELLDLAVTYCEPDGFFASLDSAIVPDENPIAAALIHIDRGQHVRSPVEYQMLLGAKFASIRCEVRQDLMRIPYTLIFFRATPQCSSRVSPSR